MNELFTKICSHLCWWYCRFNIVVTVGLRRGTSLSPDDRADAVGLRRRILPPSGDHADIVGLRHSSRDSLRIYTLGFIKLKDFSPLIWTRLDLYIPRGLSSSLHTANWIICKLIAIFTVSSWLYDVFMNILHCVWDLVWSKRKKTLIKLFCLNFTTSFVSIAFLLNRVVTLSVTDCLRMGMNVGCVCYVHQLFFWKCTKTSTRLSTYDYRRIVCYEVVGAQWFFE